MLKDFVDWLQEYKIIALAFGFILGTSSNTVVNSLVDNIIMPFFNPLFEGISWEEITINIGAISIKIGQFTADFLQFVILAFAVYFIAKKLLKMEKIKG